MTTELTTEERVKKCGEAFQTAMQEYGCVVYAALQIGNADPPLLEVAGLPVVVKLACDDKKAQPKDG